MKTSRGQRSGLDDLPGATLGPLSRAARQVADGGVPAELSPLGWERLQRARVRRARAARRWTAGVTIAALVFLGGLVSGKLWLGRARDISYLVEGAALGEGGYLHEIGGNGARLRFSEGTKIDLDAGARASVVASGPHGAHLRLESGRAHLEVVHRPDSRWSVDAGPFSIAVTGTIFDVNWAGGDELLEVSLLRGAVTVRGPLASEGVTLRPGQRLVAHLRQRQFQVEELAPPAAGTVAAPPSSAGAAAPGAPFAVAAASAPGAPPTAGGGGLAAPAAPAPATATEPPPVAGTPPAQAAAYRRLVAHLRGRPLRAGTPPQRAKYAGVMASSSGSQASSSAATPPPAAPPAAGTAQDSGGVAAPAAAGVAAHAAIAVPPAPEPPAGAESAAIAAASAPAGWPKRVAKGDFRGVLRDSEQYGVEACLTGCDRAALAALADAARYAGSPAVARRALLAERGRFPGSPPAQAAAFLLGRMADEDGQPARDALNWYDRYLDEAPDGTYAAEALGRKMLVVNRMGDHAAAGRIAGEYLRRFPDGSYISQATTLLKAP